MTKIVGYRMCIRLRDKAGMVREIQRSCLRLSTEIVRKYRPPPRFINLT